MQHQAKVNGVDAGRPYAYVGPEEIRLVATAQPAGRTIGSVAELEAWVRTELGRLTASEPVTVTFVIDRHGDLRIAGRHSEHVACAGGEPVLSAGELTFVRVRSRLVVDEVTNQSTGYCPEPGSWPAVAAALGRAGLPTPGGFTREYHFRRCPACATINLIKDEVFECAVCAAALPAGWNFAQSEP